MFHLTLVQLTLINRLKLWQSKVLTEKSAVLQLEPRLVGLVDTGVAAGSYGSATAIPTFTVDAKGRLSESSTVAIGTAMTLAGDTGSKSLSSSMIP